jgi:hypothetical protein
MAEPGNTTSARAIRGRSDRRKLRSCRIGAKSRCPGWLLIPVLLLTACGGGGGGGSPPPPSPPPPPPAPARDPLIPAGTPVLIFASSFATNDQFDTVNETIHVFAPETGEVLAIESNQRFSFAASTIAPFTFDDRLYVLTNRGDVSGYDEADWEEVDVAAPVERSDGGLAEPLPVIATAYTNRGNSDRNCLAVVGETLFWKTPDSAGGLRSVDFGTEGFVDGTLLIPGTDPDHCYETIESADGMSGPAARVGGMDVAEGQWYGTRFDPDTGLMEFFTRDPADGAPALLATYTPPDHDLYNRAYSFAFDGGFVYWARVNAGNRLVEIWRYEFVGLPQLLLSVQADGVSVSTVSDLDMDAGYGAVVVSDGFSGMNHVLLFDTNANAAEVLDLFDVVAPIGGQLPPTFRDLNVLFRVP